VRDADRVIGLIEAEEQGPAQLIVNRVKPDMIRRGEMLGIAAVVELLAIDLIGVVPEDEAILIATNQGRPIALSSDSSMTGRAFHNIARRLRGEEVPFLTLREQGVLEWLFRFMRSGGD